MPIDSTDWRSALAEVLPLFGHRNWIVIADSAYPLQTQPGIRMVAADVDLLIAVDHVLQEIAAAPHITPVIYTDAELAFMDEEDAPGISDLQRELAGILSSHPTVSLPHEEIIAKLAEAGQNFHVFFIKTNGRLPYTSVFLQLECGYWNPEAEERLRERMAGV